MTCPWFDGFTMSGAVAIQRERAISPRVLLGVAPPLDLLPRDRKKRGTECNLRRRELGWPMVGTTREGKNR
jgi:hypothetical protein